MQSGTNPNIGISTNPIASNDGFAVGGDGSNDGKSYEVSKSINKKEDSNNIIPVIIFMIILGIIVGYGFIRSRSES